ncbi:MAG TPA: hypothetical protein VGW77_14725 [Candidatus Binatia bacterium]|jgi:hypothetical protein|nr:hypothetical protein [Candidatus Binatia bacterium]
MRYNARGNVRDCERGAVEKLLQANLAMWYPDSMINRELLLFWIVIGLYGCSTGTYTPGATLLSGMQLYEGEMQRVGNSPQRWPERQQAGGSLKTVITATVGGSTEFYRLIDLDTRKREFVITMRETSLPNDRVQEMKDELVKMSAEVVALKPIIRAQIAALPVQRDGQQRVESVATLGLLTLALESFSSTSGTRGIEAPSTKVDQYVVTDLGSFATVRSPDGQTHRCSVFSIADEGAGMKCEPLVR